MDLRTFQHMVADGTIPPEGQGDGRSFVTIYRFVIIFLHLPSHVVDKTTSKLVHILTPKKVTVFRIFAWYIGTIAPDVL